MRRKDREIRDKAVLLRILDSSDTCRLAFNTNGAPYIVPLNFGYRWDDALELYFHCAPEGRKIDLLRADNRVGFEIDTSHGLVQSDRACGWGMRYVSIIGTGTIEEIESVERKRGFLDAIMVHYGYPGKPEYDDAVFRNTTVLRLVVNSFAGKTKR